MDPLSNFQVSLDAISKDEWNRLLGQFDDALIQQTWDYGAVCWGEDQLSHLLLKQKDVVVAMAQVRIVKVPVICKGIAYLRWGPLFQTRHGEPDADRLRAIISAFQLKYATDQGHALRIMPNAVAGTPRGTICETVLREAGFTVAEDNSVYRTLLVDLTPPLEEVRRKLEQKWRNQLNQSERNQLTVTEGTDDASWQTFEKLYCDMMARKRFDTTVSIKDFGEIQKTLPAELKMRVFIASAAGEPVAGIACSFVGDTGIYLLGATNEAALKLRAANLLQWEAMKRLKQLGVRHYDLGGIDPEANPGGFHFKSGLSGQDVSQLPAYDFYRSANQRLMLKTAFKAAAAVRSWKVRRHKKEVAAT